MQMLKRISLFLVVNFLIIVTISITSNIIFAVLGIKATAGTQGLLIMCAIMGFSGSLISLMISKWIAKRMYGIQIIDPNSMNLEHREIYQTVLQLAQKAGLPKTPEVGIYEAPEINAFATGPSKSNSLVAVSTGLLRTMNKEERDGVLGHEIAHIANGDMVTMTLIQGVVNTFVLFLSRILAGFLSGSRDEDNRGGGMQQFMLTMLFDVVFAFLASIVVNYFSRRREFRADAGGAKLAGRDKMVAGLRKLQAQYQAIPADNGALATMKISNRSSGLMALFSTHPPLEERIRRLSLGV